MRWGLLDGRRLVSRLDAPDEPAEEGERRQHDEDGEAPDGEVAGAGGAARSDVLILHRYRLGPRSVNGASSTTPSENTSRTTAPR